MGVAVQKCKWL